MRTRIICLIVPLLLFLGCSNEATLPEPEVYSSSDRLKLVRLEGALCHAIPYGEQLLIRDSSRFSGMICPQKNRKIDFNHYDVLVYNRGQFNQITNHKSIMYAYIDHHQRKYFIDAVVATVPNRSGLTSNGYSTIIVMMYKIPKIPPGYRLEIRDK